MKQGSVSPLAVLGKGGRYRKFESRFGKVRPPPPGVGKCASIEDQLSVKGSVFTNLSLKTVVHRKQRLNSNAVPS